MTSMGTKKLRPILLAFGLIVLMGAFSVSVNAQESYADGSLLRLQGDTRIFAVASGHKRQIPNTAIFNSYGWSMADVRDVADAVLSTVPDTRLIKTSDSQTIFDITSGSRVAVSSAEGMAARGFSFGEVATVNQTEMESYPLPGGESVTPAPTESSAPALPPPPPTEPLILQKITEARKILHAAPPLYPQETKIGELRAMTTGMVNADVATVQSRLQTLGFFPDDKEINGVFGPTTLRAVKAFQAAKGITMNGRVGPQTLEALQKSGLKRPVEGTVVKSWFEAVPQERKVLLAAWNPEIGDIKLISITFGSHQVKSGKSTRTVYDVTSHTPGFALRYKGGSGVNVQYAITSPAGYQVLADRFPIFDASVGDLGSFPPSEEVYVPYSDDLRTPEIVAAGRRYLDETVTAAMDDLRKKGVMSASKAGLVADLTDPAELKNIAIIEHMDVSEFRNTDDKAGVVNRIFTILGTNRDDAFRFAGSSKGALGIAQFIPSSYRSISRSYPAAALNPDFIKGMADHVNAFEAMSLHHDMTANALEDYAREHLTVDPREFPLVMAEVRAAAYNTGTTRVRSAIKKFGAGWQTASSTLYGLYRETRSYLEKFKAVRDVLASL